MKNTILQLFATCLLGAFVVSPNLRGQGTFAANNINGTGTTHSTNFGFFFEADGAPYTATPINVTILGGPDVHSLAPIVTLWGPNALTAVAPGRYTDSSGGIYTIPGVAPGQPATLQVLAWRGSAATFGDSDPRVDRFWPFTGTSWVDATWFTFINPTGSAVPASLDGMPAMWRVLDVPEPSAVSLLAVGLAMAVLLRGARKKAETSP